MPVMLDYSPPQPRRSFCGLDRTYFAMTCMSYLMAISGEVMMPRTPHRFDPMVQWAMSLADISAAISGLLFLWGLVHLARRGWSKTALIVRVAWVANGALPIISMLLTHSGGTVLFA